MRKTTLFLLILTLFFFSSCFEEVKEAEKKNIKNEIPTENINTDNKAIQVDALIAKYVKEDQPGVALLIAKEGKILYKKGYGLANLKSKTPIETNSIFYLASVSKQFTAMAIMILAQEGKLNYDDPLTKFFPSFPNYAKKITVRHLLHHTSGITDYMGEDGSFEENSSKVDSKIVTRKAIEILSKEPKTDFEAGEKYEYSNSGYVILAGIVEEVSKKSFPEFLKQKIFEPLLMNDTSIIDTQEQLPKNLVRGYTGENFEDANLGKTQLDLVYGDGGVLSTVEDLYKWDQALYTEQLVKQETLNLAFTSGATNDDEKIDYGFGWTIGKLFGKKLIEHDGSWYGWSTVISRIPEENFAVILLSNEENFEANKIANKIAKIYLKE